MPDSFLLLGAVFIGFLVILWFINKKLSSFSSNSPELVEWLKSTNTRLEEQTRNLNDRLDTAARVIMGVQRSVGEMSEIGRSMKDLQEFLRSPKLRGNLGEQVLRELLSKMLPKQSFHLQYAFKSGAIVDAVVVTSGGVIPIDSKFPMENFRRLLKSDAEDEKTVAKKEFIRDVKRHIDDISRKYILTDEGTIDYALMYVPSEAVYYEMMTDDGDLMDYAYSRRVLPVSPTTFYAYLRAILMSFEGQKIETQAREILAAIRAIGKDYEKVQENLVVLGKHINNSYNTMTSVLSGYTQLGQKISSTQRLSHEAKEDIKQLKVTSHAN